MRNHSSNTVEVFGDKQRLCNSPIIDLKDIAKENRENKVNKLNRENMENKGRREDKENIPFRNLKKIASRGFGPKYSISPQNNLPVGLKKLELISVDDYDPKVLGDNHKKFYYRILEKITSQVNLIEGNNSRPHSIHKKKIIEKLSKSNNLKAPEKDLNKPCCDAIKKDEVEVTLNKTFSNSSSTSFNIWDNEIDIPLFDLFKYRFEQFPQQKEKITPSLVITKIKQLLGSNIDIQCLGQFPWYTYDIQDQYKSYTNMNWQKNQPQTLLINREVPLRIFRHRGRVIDYQHEINQNQISRIEYKLKPMRKALYGHHLRREQIIHDSNVVSKRGNMSQVIGQRFIGSPEILLKRHQQQQQKIN